MWFNTDNWTWAGFFFYIADVARFFAFFYLFIFSLLFIMQLVSGDFYFSPQLPVALEIQNLSEQFNSQLPPESVNFLFDTRVSSKVDIYGKVSAPDLFLHIAPVIRLVWAALAVFILGLIRDVLRTLRLGKPFQPEIGRKLYWIGGAILLITPVNFLYEWMIYRFMLEYPLPENLSMLWPLPDFTYMFVGLFVLSIAYVFTEGARLAREQKLTV